LCKHLIFEILEDSANLPRKSVDIQPKKAWEIHPIRVFQFARA